MRSIILATVATVAFVSFAAPAFAINCKAAKHVVLDFTGADRPLLNTDLEPVSETCVPGNYASVTYELKDMAGRYESPKEAFDAFHAVKFLKSKGVVPLDMGSMFKFVEKKQAEAKGNIQASLVCLPGQMKLYEGTADEKCADK